MGAYTDKAEFLASFGEDFHVQYSLCWQLLRVQDSSFSSCQSYPQCSLSARSVPISSWSLFLRFWPPHSRFWLLPTGYWLRAWRLLVRGLRSYATLPHRYFNFRLLFVIDLGCFSWQWMTGCRCLRILFLFSWLVPPLRTIVTDGRFRVQAANWRPLRSEKINGPDCVDLLHVGCK